MRRPTFFEDQDAEESIDTFDRIMGVILDVLFIIGVFSAAIASCVFYVYFSS